MGGKGTALPIDQEPDLSGTWLFDYGEGETYQHEFAFVSKGMYQVLSDGNDDGTLSITGNQVIINTGDPGDPITIVGIYNAANSTITGNASTNFNETWSFIATRQ